MTRRARDWGTLVLGAGVLYALAFVCWQVLGRDDGATTTAVADAAFLPIGLLTVVLGWRVAANSSLDRRERRAWLLLGTAFALNLVGDSLWFLYEVVWGKSPFPSPADAPYLLFYVFLLWGLLTLPVARRSARERLKLGMDTGTVFVAAAMVLWYLVLGPTAAATGSSSLETVLSLAYPVGDLVLLFGIAVVIIRGTTASSRRALTVLVAGISLYVVADIAFGALSLEGAYRAADWPDTLFMVASLVIATSAWVQQRGASAGVVREEERPISTRVSVLPYGAIAAVWGMLLFAARDEPMFPLLGLLSGALALTLLVFGRQVLAVRENSELMAMYLELAGTDSLTGIDNRRRFLEQARRSVSAVARTGDVVSALMVDLDGFKQVNDSLGHATGDEVLCRVAEALRSSLRGHDLLGRYGGDEFAVLLPGSDALEASVVATRIRTAVSQADVHDVSVSVGVATFRVPDDAVVGVDELLRRADEALYRAKRAGRDCARAYAVTSA